MKTRKLSDDFSVAKQISVNDLTLVSSLGFKSVMCNRPDGQDAAQELFEVIENAAQISRLDACYVPVESLPPTEEDVSKFMIAYNKLPKPIFAYGDDGSRCEALFEAMKAQMGESAK